jgi:hypothetical protein
LFLSINLFCIYVSTLTVQNPTHNNCCVFFFGVDMYSSLSLSLCPLHFFLLSLSLPLSSLSLCHKHSLSVSFSPFLFLLLSSVSDEKPSSSSYLTLLCRLGDCSLCLKIQAAFLPRHIILFHTTHLLSNHTLLPLSHPSRSHTRCSLSQYSDTMLSDKLSLPSHT